MLIKRLVNLFFVTIFSLLFVTACDNNNIVLSDLSEQQANHTLAVLHQYNINAKKSGSLKTGYSVSVDKNETTTALSIINQYQLPLQSELQISQAFSNDSLVSSPGIDRAKLIAIQEQRIEQSLKIIDKVVNAKVNISFPIDVSDITDSQFTEHASVLITYQGNIDDNLFVDRIKLLIKNSLDNIQFKNISVVLFPAQKIQYISPVTYQTSLIGERVVIIAIVIFLSIFILAVSFIFFRKKIYHAEHSSKLEDSIDN
ncbi:TPA: type III secretion system inner membrane ring lipoprotein SctJ [Salmonella enterica]